MYRQCDCWPVSAFSQCLSRSCYCSCWRAACIVRLPSRRHNARLAVSGTARVHMSRAKVSSRNCRAVAAPLCSCALTACRPPPGPPPGESIRHGVAELILPLAAPGAVPNAGALPAAAVSLLQHPVDFGIGFWRHRQLCFSRAAFCIIEQPG